MSIASEDNVGTVTRTEVRLDWMTHACARGHTHRTYLWG